MPYFRYVIVSYLIFLQIDINECLQYRNSLKYLRTILSFKLMDFR